MPTMTEVLDDLYPKPLTPRKIDEPQVDPLNVGTAPVAAPMLRPDVPVVQAPDAPAPVEPPVEEPPVKTTSLVGEAIDQLAAQRVIDKRDKEREAAVIKYVQETAKPPGEAAEIMKYAAALPEYPPDYIANNLEEVRRKFLASGYDWQALLDTHPVFSKMVGDPSKASLVRDDSSALTTLETAITGRWENHITEEEYIDPNTGEVTPRGATVKRMVALPAIAAAVRDAFSSDFDLMGWQAERFLFGEQTLPEFNPRTGKRYGAMTGPEEERERKSYNQWLKDHSVQGRDYVGNNETGAIGTAKRFVAGAALFPIKISPMILGSIGAGAVSGPAGIFAFNTLYAAPGMYDRLADLKTAGGEQISPTAARAATAVGAPLIGWVQTAGLSNVLVGPASKALEQAAVKTVERALADQTMLRAFGDWGLRAGLHTVEGAATFAFQSGVDAGVEQLTRSWGLGEQIKPGPSGRYSEMVTDAMWEGFKEGLASMPVFAAWSGGRALLHDMGQVKRATETKVRMQIMADAAEAAKHPEIVEQLAAGTAASPGAATHVYLDIEAVKETAAKAKLDPREVLAKVMGDKGAAWDAAVEQGAADIAVPIAKAQRHLAGSKVFGPLMIEEGRFDPRDLSYAKMKREVERWTKAADEAGAKPVDQMDPESRAIYEKERAKVFAMAEKNPNMKASAEEVADSAARLVLSLTTGFYERTGRKEPLISWYDRTYGPNGIWNAQVEKRLSVTPQDYFPAGHEISVLKPPDASGRRFYGPAEVVRWKSASEVIVEIKQTGQRVTMQASEIMSDARISGRPVVRTLQVGPEVEIGEAQRQEAVGKLPGIEEPGTWGGLQYPFYPKPKITEIPLTWGEAKTEGPDVGRITDTSGRFTILPLESGEASVKEIIKNTEMSHGKFPSVEEAKAYAQAQSRVAERQPVRQHILINKTGDAIVLVHEMAHAFSNILEELAQGSTEMRKLHDQLSEALGYKGADGKSAGEARTARRNPAMEERLAHAFEQYMINGASPSLALAPVFARFMAWGSEVAKKNGIDRGEVGTVRWYARDLQGRGEILASDAPGEGLKAETLHKSIDPVTGKERVVALSEPLKQVFDSMLATTEEIKAAREMVEAVLPFDAAAKNMTPEERAKYDEENKALEGDAQAVLLRQIIEASRRENSTFMKKELAKLTAEVREEMKSDPIYRALTFFRTGEGLPEGAAALLLNPEGKPYRFLASDLIERYGKEKGQEYIDLLKSLSKHAVTTDPTLGLDADFLVGLLTNAADPLKPGENAVDKMLSGFRTALPEAEHLAREAKARLRAKYQTDLIDRPQELQDRALDAVINEKMAKKVLKELAAMGRSLDPDRAARSSSVTEEQMKRVADRLVLMKSLREINAERYARAIGTATVKARDFAKAGEMTKAWDASEAALLNIYMYKAARAMENMIEKSYTTLSEKATSDAWRAKLGLAEPKTLVYQRTHDAILEAVGMRARHPDAKPIDAEVLGEFIKAANERGQADQIDGWDVETVHDLLRGKKAWNDLTPAEAANVFSAILNIKHLADGVNEIRINGNRESLDAMAEELRLDLEKRPFKGKAPVDMALVPRTREIGLKVESFMANTEEFRTLAMKVGPSMKRLIYDEYVRAKYAKFELEQLVTGEFKAAYDAMPEEIRNEAFDEIKGLDRELPVPEDVNLAGPVSRSWLWMIMLNMGNEGNRKRLLGGMGWNVDQVIQAAQRHLSPAEMEFIQKIWSLSDKTLWPKVVEKEVRRTGLEPDPVVPMEIKMEFDGVEHTYTGGYFPAKYDPRASQRRIDADITRTSEGPVRMRAGTFKSYTRARVENYADIVNLEWSVLPSHFAEVVHDLAFDEYVRNTNKLIFNKKYAIPDVMYQRLGEEGAKQPRAFLEAVAHEQTDPVAAHMARSLGILEAGRSRLVYGALGYNVPVAMADFLHPIAVAAFGRIKSVDMLKSLASTPLGYSEMRTFAMERSKELPIRQERSDIKLREEMMLQARGGAPSALEKALGISGPDGRNGPLAAARRAAFYLLDRTDRIVSTQIWMAKYREMKRIGATEEKAIWEADDTVREAMPTHSTAEMAAILRDKKTIGSLLIFQGYYSKLLQMSKLTAEPAFLAWREPGNDLGAKLEPTAVAAARIAAGLAVASIMGDYVMGHGKEADETWGEWWGRKATVAPFTMIPFASNVAEPLADIAWTGKTKKFSVRAAPILAATQMVTDTIGKLASDNRSGSQKTFDAIELALFAARLPARQPRRSAEFMVNVGLGDESPEGVFDFFNGLAYGKRRKQSANPLSDLSKALEQ